MGYGRGGSQKAHLECAIMGWKDFGLRMTGPHIRDSESWAQETLIHPNLFHLREENQALP